ncbi:MAG TPA: hypothetical protein VMQ45_06400 [Burkholderiaceae bacterium]|nr:hypothetical protein [Burkholderiaceae bacterium]
MRVGANPREREFNHVGLRDDHRARGAEPVNHWRIARRRWRIDEHLGPRAGRLAGHVEQVLDADDRPIERSERYAVAHSGIGGVRGVARGLRIDGEAGAGTLALRIGDMGESFVQPVAGGPFRRRDRLGRLGLCPRSVRRSKKRCRRGCKIQELSTWEFHRFCLR